MRTLTLCLLMVGGIACISLIFCGVAASFAGDFGMAGHYLASGFAWSAAYLHFFLSGGTPRAILNDTACYFAAGGIEMLTKSIFL